ncbi:MAG: cytochrome c peroxidase [Myxococcota bacterium]
MKRLALIVLVGCGSTEAPPVAPAPAPVEAPAPVAPAAPVAPTSTAAFAPLPADMHGDTPSSAELVTLGRALYFEPRMSLNQQIACNSCHPLDKYGADGEPTSPGHKGVRGTRNSPTTYNAALHLAQFWDGRAATVEDQAKGPVLNPVEMAMPDAGFVLEVLKSIPGYQPMFAAAFPGEADPITYDNFAKAVGAFERGLVTQNSKFDQYLGGKTDAMTPAEVAGLELFVATGCTACHAGATVGGAMYQKLGLVNAYETKDLGRFEVTKNEADKFMFKVPSLRNVTHTGPYFHDGSIASLDEAVKKMAHHQLGKELTDAEVASIVGFLDTLTGDLPTDYVAKPELPPSGPKTPKPKLN